MTRRSLFLVPVTALAAKFKHGHRPVKGTEISQNLKRIQELEMAQNIVKTISWWWGHDGIGGTIRRRVSMHLRFFETAEIRGEKLVDFVQADRQRKYSSVRFLDSLEGSATDENFCKKYAFHVKGKF